jgi:hypothetical protein
MRLKTRIRRRRHPLPAPAAAAVRSGTMTIAVGRGWTDAARVFLGPAATLPRAIRTAA